MKLLSAIISVLILSLSQQALALNPAFGFRMSGGVANNINDTAVGHAEFYLGIPFSERWGMDLGFAQEAIVTDKIFYTHETKVNLLQSRFYFKEGFIKPWVGLAIGSAETWVDSEEYILISEGPSGFTSSEASLELLIVDQERFKMGLFGLGKHSRVYGESLYTQEYGINLSFTPSWEVSHNSYGHHHHTHLYLDPDILYGVARVAAEIAPKIVRALSK